MKILLLKSLRSRYAVVASFLAVVVIAGAAVADRYMTALRHESTDNIEIRNELLTYSRHVRDAIWQARQSLAAFLLDPHKPEHQEHIRSGIDRARDYVQRLQRLAETPLPDTAKTAAELRGSIEQLEHALQAIVATRLNALEQYPSMAITTTEMLPLNQEFYTAISVAMEEIESSGTDALQSATYLTYVQTRHIWTQMVSQFRMYLANRLGSFSEDNLQLQEQDIEQHYAELMQKVTQLKQIGAAGGLGFLGTESLPAILSSAERWLDAYSRIKQLHATDAWRADVKQMKETVEPMFIGVWTMLIGLDMAIETRADADVQTLTGAAQTQTMIFWSVTGLCVIFIVAGFFALERMVLRPLSRISMALKAEASGADKIELPDTSAVETQDLLEAFAEMRKQVHSRQVVLEHQALHDALTSLPNRTLLTDRLQQSIYTAKRKQRALAVMILDLDRFKEVNDTLGHEMGDRLLTEVAARLLNALRDSDTIARFGGDEFCILLNEADDLHAQQVAERLRRALEEPVIIDDQHLLVGVSIGIATYPQHGTTPQTLIQRADVAMYVAKRSHTGYSIYNPDNDQHSIQRLALVGDLREAIDNNTLELHYQPKIAIGTGRVTGVEALLRWQHPKHGRIPPDQIIPLAEQTGLIRPLTRWVLNTALRQCAAWKREQLNLHVAVNLSAYCLQDNELDNWISEWFATNNAATSDLVLEITESGMMADPNKAIEVLTRYGEMGIGISVDDFGTGFSSLAYLKKLPIDELKIDRSFVMDMLANENDAVIVRSTIDLAHNLGLRIVAEGVENSEMLELLKTLGCDYAQGYHISRPVPADELLRWYRACTTKTAPPPVQGVSAIA